MDLEHTHTSKQNRPIVLNAYQKRAVEDTSPACLVNACVGSGKTTVLTEKIRYLHAHCGVEYSDMIVLTFTNKAAEEIAQRLGISGRVATLRVGEESDAARRIDAANDEVSCFGTFHGVARYLLENRLPVEEAGWHPNFTIIEPDEEEKLAKSLIKENGLKIRYMNRLKKRLENGPGRSSDQEDFEKLLSLLRKERQAQNRMNFDDLIRISTDLLQKHPLDPKWLIVDELQDCNRMQITFMQNLRGENTRFFAVGDPNQMIYGFRGSQDTLFYRIKEAFHATELSLPVNYRCNPTILAVANRFRQFGSAISSAYEEGLSDGMPAEKIPIVNYYDPFQEAQALSDKIRMLHEDGLAYREIAVLYRLKEQGEALQNFFVQQGISFETSETLEAGKILNEETATMDEESTDGVRLLTLHASKGLEFHTVFIIGLNQGLIPLNTGKSSDMEEERRLLFVGITRAKEHLELSYYTNPGIPRVMGSPSAFLLRMPENLTDWPKRPNPKERTRNLQSLRRQVADYKSKHSTTNGENGQEEKNTEAPLQQEPGERRIRHPKYGEGTVLSESDMMVKAMFPGYGEKEFMKAFGGFEIF